MVAGQTAFKDRCAAATCRGCGGRGVEPVLDLGRMPLSDGLLTREQLSAPEPHFPLEVGFCPSCALVQITETVPPEVLFGGDYPYFSSFSDHLLRHSRENALGLISSRKLDASSMVVELASNDGYLLRNFVERGIPVLGIDPAPGPAAAAKKIGVNTLNAFFTKDLAAKLVAEGIRADVIIANNVLAHVADTNGFLQGVAMLLKDTGIASIEVPYLRDLVDHCEFDTIYHEHLCYFSVTALDRLVRRNGLFLQHIDRIPIHGGSLRLHIGKQDAPDESVTTLLKEERDLGMDTVAYYQGFAARVRSVADRVRTLLTELKDRGKRIAAYGAAAKGAILVNYIGAGTDTIEFVVDRNTHKQGRFMPGKHIPILEPAELLRRRPDYVLILPWNFKDEILQQQAEFRRLGGKFIIPIPTPTIA